MERSDLTTSTTRGRYRAAGAATTPLHTFADNLGPTARKAAALAATSGIILTVAAPGAVAAPQHGAPAPLASPAAEPEASVATTAVITVAADAAWSVTSGSVSSEAPPPPPPPPPAPVVQRAPVVSRTNERAVPAAQTQQTAPAATTTQAPAAPAAAPASGIGAAIVAYARQFNGVPYVWGGRSPSGFDCSGFTYYVFKNFGVNIGTSSHEQIGAGRVVSAAEARPGDLIWWPGHVGIYTGNGQHIAARNPSSALHESKIHRGGGTFIRVIE